MIIQDMIDELKRHDPHSRVKVEFHIDTAKQAADEDGMVLLEPDRIRAEHQDRYGAAIVCHL